MELNERYFKRKEFACNCGCGFDTVDAALLDILAEVRHVFGRPTYINSGCRCEKYNAYVGGASSSQHLLGRAADIRVKNVKPQEIYDFLNTEYPNELGLGNYDTFIHVDTRTEAPARWEG